MARGSVNACPLGRQAADDLHLTATCGAFRHPSIRPAQRPGYKVQTRRRTRPSRPVGRRELLDQLQRRKNQVRGPPSAALGTQALDHGVLSLKLSVSTSRTRSFPAASGGRITLRYARPKSKSATQGRRIGTIARGGTARRPRCAVPRAVRTHRRKNREARPGCPPEDQQGGDGCAVQPVRR